MAWLPSEELEELLLAVIELCFAVLIALLFVVG
jgi:hypothetical protein